MSGPLPTGTAIRRNKPTIPTTALPAGGRTDPVPDPPVTYVLGEKAMDWWGWAWTTPQAAAWDDGALFAAARRAQLEDDLATLENIEIDLEFLCGEEPNESMRNLQFMIGKLKALAGGKLAVSRQMTELDDRLGLTPKGLAQLRWTIVDAPAAPKKSGTKAENDIEKQKAKRAAAAAS